jgi:XTP/dITP diphosphohydrolase
VKLIEIIIASHNKGKVREIAELINPLGIEAKTAAEYGVEEPEETGRTFAENAILKAEHTAKITKKAALADDSGMIVSALGGQPGIYSARWGGENKDFYMAMERVRQELIKATGTENGHKASFFCALALAVTGQKTEVFEGEIKGGLTFPPRGEHGFGYDPIFIPDGYEITFAEFEPAKKYAISHRAKAFAKFLQYLENKNAA